MRTAKTSVSFPLDTARYQSFHSYYRQSYRKGCVVGYLLPSSGSSENHPWSTFQIQSENPQGYLCVPLFLPEGFLSHILPSWANMFNSLVPVAETWKNTLFPFLLHFLLCFLPFQTLTLVSLRSCGCVNNTERICFLFCFVLNCTLFLFLWMNFVFLLMDTDSSSCYCIYWIY